MTKEIPFKEILSPQRPILGDEMSVIPWRLLRIVALKRIFPDINDTLIYHAGKEIGIALDVAGVNELLKVVDGWKIGIVELVEKKKNKIVIDVKECVSCSGITPTGEPMCFFEGGLIDGGSTKVLGKQVTVAETRCMGGFGDDACRFEASF